MSAGRRTGWLAARQPGSPEVRQPGSPAARKSGSPTVGRKCASGSLRVVAVSAELFDGGIAQQEALRSQGAEVDDRYCLVSDAVDLCHGAEAEGLV